jgi:4-amino-4-deoxy-L-arabinose transferase-like glycosyltransferase
MPQWLRASTRWYRLPTPDLLIAVALFALALWVGLGHVATTPFHRDEARWVGRAYFIEELFHPTSDTWADAELTRNQPPVGSYLMGIGLWFQGHDVDTTPRNLLYDFTRSERWNQLRGRIPDQADIDAGRRTAAAIGALLTVLVYAIGRRLTNRVGGVIAALVLIPNSLYIYLSSLANSDMPLAFFFAGSVLAALALAQRPTWWRAVILGVMLGLGTATKLSPILVAGVVAGYGVMLLIGGQPWRRRTPEDQSRIGLGLMLLTVPFTAFATFVLSYPYLWPDPVRRTIYMFQFRSSEMDAQGELWQDRQVTGVFDALSRLRFHFDEQFSVSRWLSGEFQQRFGWGWDAPWLDLGLGFLGAGLLVLMAAHYGPRSRYALVAVVLLAQCAVTIAGLQADFERYYLPFVVTFAITMGLLGGQLWAWWGPVRRWVTARMRRRGAESRATVTPPVAAPAPASGLVARAQRQFWSLPAPTPALAGGEPGVAPGPDAPPAGRGERAFRALAVAVTMAVGVVVAQVVAVIRGRR